MNATPIATAAQELEGILRTAGDEGISLDRHQIDLFFAAVDAMADAGKRLQAKEPIETEPLSEVTARLAAAAAAARAGGTRSD